MMKHPKLDFNKNTIAEFIKIVKQDKDLKEKNISQIVKYFENNEEEKLEKVKPNFRIDEEMKYALHKVESQKLIALINKLCGTKYAPNSKVTILKNEHMKTTGKLTKGYVIGDFAVKIESLNNDDIVETVVIEFQSSKDKDIPFRIYVYGFNAAEIVNMEIKTIKNGEEVLEKVDVLVEPYELIIYTTLSEEKEGTKRFHRSKPHFEVNGIAHSVNTNDVVTDVIPYFNILRMTIDEFDNEAFDFLQPLFLYKYKKYPKLIQEKNSNFEFDLKTIHDNISNLTGVSKVISKESFVNVTYDINTILQKDKKQYAKEIKYMEYLAGTYVGQCIEQGIEQGRELGFEEGIELYQRLLVAQNKEEFIINMLSDYTDKQIAKVSGKTLDEIAKIRAENS